MRSAASPIQAHYGNAHRALQSSEGWGLNPVGDCNPATHTDATVQEPVAKVLFLCERTKNST